MTLTATIILTGCDNFENRFYERIDKGEINAIKNGADTFDLSTITDFEWDSVILIRGNESVPIFKEEIEEIINNRNSDIHWEDRRFNGKEDTRLVYKTKDLPTFKDRFYFLTPDKKIIEKEIKSGIYEHKPAFDIQPCYINTINRRYWLSKNECEFVLKSNSKTVGQGTLFLYPNCLTRQITKDDIKGEWYLNKWTMYHTLSFADTTVFVDNHIDSVFTLNYSFANDTLILHDNNSKVTYKEKIITLTQDTLIIKSFGKHRDILGYSRTKREWTNE